MPTLFQKNLNLNANATSVAGAAQSYRLSRVHICAPGARCQLCHQPIKKGADVRSDRTDRQITIGLDCLERLEFIQRSGRQPEKGELAVSLKQRKHWKGDARRRPIVASAVAFFQRRRAGLPSDVRLAFDFLEVAGHPRTIEEGEMLLTYYRRADPLWLLRLVRQTNDLEHWRSRSGTVLAIKVAGTENFRQVRRLDEAETVINVYEGKVHLHIWRYNHETGEISMTRGPTKYWWWSSDLVHMRERRGREQLDKINQLRLQIGWKPLRKRENTFHFGGKMNYLTDSEALERAEQEVRHKLQRPRRGR